MARRFSAHLGYLFTEVPLPARFAAAAAAGFRLVEHPAPFDLPAPRLRALLSDLGLRMVQIGTGPGGAGGKGLAGLPGHEAAFRDQLLRALDHAEAIGCRLVHPMAGIAGPDADPGRHAGVWLENMAFAAAAVRDRPLSIIAEPISRAAVPGYVLHRLDQYLALARRLDHPPLLLLDSFHAAMNGEDAPGFITAEAARLAHVHVADSPGRHEPGTGAQDFAALDAALAAVGYCGAIGCEYAPQGGTAAGLGWRERWPGPVW